MKLGHFDEFKDRRSHRLLPAEARGPATLDAILDTGIEMSENDVDHIPGPDEPELH